MGGAAPGKRTVSAILRGDGYIATFQTIPSAGVGRFGLAIKASPNLVTSFDSSVCQQECW